MTIKTVHELLVTAMTYVLDFEHQIAKARARHGRRQPTARS